MRCLLRALTLLGLLLVACGPTPESSEQKPLRIGYSPLTLNSPLFAAIEHNLFPGPIEPKAFQSTNEMMTALLAGRIDLASAVTTESVLQAHNLQPAVLKTVLYNAFSKDTSADGILVSEPTEEADCASLELTLVGAYPSQSIVTYLEAAFGSSLTVQQIPPNAIFEAIGSGAIPAAYLLEPQISVAVSKGVGEVVCWSPIAKRVRDPAIVGSHAVNPKSVHSRGWAISAIQRALVEGAELAATESASSSRAIAKYTSLPESTVEQVGLPIWIVPSADSLEALRATCSLLSSRGVVPSCENLDETQVEPAN